MLGPVNTALWFVPLIAGLYLVFPLVYAPLARARHASQLAVFLLAVVGIEAAYRDVAILERDAGRLRAGHNPRCPRGSHPVGPYLCAGRGLPALGTVRMVPQPRGRVCPRQSSGVVADAPAGRRTATASHEGARDRARDLGRRQPASLRWAMEVGARQPPDRRRLPLALVARAARIKPDNARFGSSPRLADGVPAVPGAPLVGYAISQSLRILAIQLPAVYLTVFALVIPTIWLARAALMRLDRSDVPRPMIAGLLRPVARVRPVSRPAVGG
jgi:hypothetical protein